MSNSKLESCPNRLRDCYFFFYSTCTKSDCEFRHCVDALGTEKTCRYWLMGQCKNQKCRFRHMKIVKRSDTPCYYEKKASGCRKMHCPFKHQQERDLKFFQDLISEKEKVILPTKYDSKYRLRSKSAAPAARNPMKFALQQASQDKFVFVNHANARPQLEKTRALSKSQQALLAKKQLQDKARDAQKEWEKNDIKVKKSCKELIERWGKMSVK